MPRVRNPIYDDDPDRTDSVAIVVTNSIGAPTYQYSSNIDMAARGCHDWGFLAEIAAQGAEATQRGWSR